MYFFPEIDLTPELLHFTVFTREGLPWRHSTVHNHVYKMKTKELTIKKFKRIKDTSFTRFPGPNHFLRMLYKYFNQSS